MKDAADVKLDGNNCEDEQFSCFYDDPTCKDQFFQQFFKKIKLNQIKIRYTLYLNAHYIG